MGWCHGLSRTISIASVPVPYCCEQTVSACRYNFFLIFEIAQSLIRCLKIDQIFWEQIAHCRKTRTLVHAEDQT